MDPEGRYICLLCSISAFTLILVAVYIPPPYLGETLKKVLSFFFLDASPVAPILIIGDFNNFLHPYWDKMHASPADVLSRPTSLAKLLEEVKLGDLWRLRFPDSRQFSCYSSSHHSLSRIDLAVGSNALIAYVHTVEYLVRSISAHSPIHVQLSLGSSGTLSRKLWRLHFGFS